MRGETLEAVEYKDVVAPKNDIKLDGVIMSDGRGTVITPPPTVMADLWSPTLVQFMN